MSGWIKIEFATPDKPEVIQISRACGCPPDAVMGKLIRLWGWADQNSVDGSAVPVDAYFIDRLTGKRGFASALRAAGWLTGEDGKLCFPNFDRHNGKTAKGRAESARRMAKSRNVATKPQPKNHENSCENVTQIPQQKAQPEKRREEKENTGNPQSPPGKPSAKKEIHDSLMQEMAWQEFAKREGLTKREWATIGTALAGIREAMPDVTPTEIARRAQNYKAFFPTWQFTSSALESHWSRCDTGEIRMAGQPTQDEAFRDAMARASAPL